MTLSKLLLSMLLLTATAFPQDDPAPTAVVAEQSDAQQPDLQPPNSPPSVQQPGQLPSHATTPINPLEQEPPGGKRVLGVLPNYRTASADLEGTTLTPKQKLTIAAKDSFDYPLFLLAAAYAGLDQLNNDDRSYGQGAQGYAKRLGAWYADEAIGNMLTEGFFPILFHQDPRYFRRGPQWGGFWKRTGYALAQVMVTHKDGGGYQFNYSEWVGNSVGTAIGNIYHVDGRDAATNTSRLLEQVGTDAFSQVIKEFWPDVKHRFFHHNQVDPSSAPNPAH
jgi:hypothetical protein